MNELWGSSNVTFLSSSVTLLSFCMDVGNLNSGLCWGSALPTEPSFVLIFQLSVACNLFSNWVDNAHSACGMVISSKWMWGLRADHWFITQIIGIWSYLLKTTVRFYTISCTFGAGSFSVDSADPLGNHCMHAVSFIKGEQQTCLTQDISHCQASTLNRFVLNAENFERPIRIGS